MATPAPAPLRLPARPDLAVAFVYLRAQAGGDFFADVPFAWSAGELRRDGVRADVFEVRYERGDDAYNRLLDLDLIARLADGGYGLVVVEACWAPTFVDAVHGLGAWLCETAPASVHLGVDFTLRHFTRDRQVLRQLVHRLRRGDDLRGLPNLRVRRPSGGRGDALASAPEGGAGAHVVPGEAEDTGPERPVPPEPAALLPFVPVTDTVVLGVAMDGRGEPPPIRKTLDTNDGCPFAKPVRDNPVYAGADLSADGVTLAGCAFCFMGGDYRALPWRETVAVHLDQIATWQTELGQLDEVVLRDQHAVRYLPHLLREAVARGLPPVGVLVPGRGDAILRYGDALREAAEVAAGTGFWFTLYLIGFESFSAPQLERFNKGVTPADYATALAALWALHRRHGDTFRLTAYGASSFVLWDPWTTLDDLQANVDFIDAHDVRPLSSGLASTRLRLYPNLPLYWLAQRDGLLVAGTGAADRGAAQTGYAAEARWQTRDGRVAAVEELTRRLLRHTHVDAQVDVLRATARWGRERWPAPLPPVDAALLAGGRDLAERSPRVQALRAEVDRAEAGWLAVQTALRAAAGATAAGGGGLSGDGERRGAAAGRAAAERHALAHAVDPAAEQADPAAAWQRLAADRQAQRHAAAAAVAARAARTVVLGASCNNRCQSCVVGYRRFDDDLEALLRKARAAGAAAAHTGQHVTFAGREPLLVRGLPKLVRAARQAGATAVELVTNGRALAAPGVAAQLVRAGVTSLLIKHHRVDAEAEDAAARAAGAGAQLRAGLVALRAEAPQLRWRALLVASRDAPDELPALVDFAAAQGARGVQLTVPVTEVDLAAFESLVAAIVAAGERAAALGLACHVD